MTEILEPPEIQERIEAMIREIDARRFRGEDPSIPVAPEESREAVVAKTLAAQLLHALLDFGGGAFNPDEKSAEKRFLAGQKRLDFWNFRDARRLFDDASKRARDPKLQQRITLFRLLTDYLRDVTMTEWDRSLPASAKAAVIEPLDRLDRLSPEERAHYRAEIERLWDLKESLKTDPALRTAWLFAQARIAFDASEGAMGVTWLLSAAHANREISDPGPYLQSLLERARSWLLRTIGEEPPAGEAEASAGESASDAPGEEKSDPAATGRKGRPEERVRPWDLYEALAASLEAATGKDPRAAARQFRIERYRDPSDAPGEGEA
jgi:hypothetical protein